MKNKNNHLKRTIPVLISVLLVFSSLFAGCSDSSVAVSGQNSGTTSSENLSDLNYVSLNEGFTDVAVKDEKSALEAIASVADTLGIEDVDKELKICDVNTVDGDSFYRFQQYYNDIPVYGKTVVVAADENGNATDLTSNMINISDTFDVKHNDMSQQDVSNEILDYINSNFEDSDEVYIDIPNIAECQLYIYQNSEFVNCLVALVPVGFYDFVIDVKTCRVIDCIDVVQDDYAATCYNSDKSEKFDGYFYSKDNEYVAYNDERNTYVSTYKKTNSHKKSKEIEFLTSTDNVFGNNQNEINEEYSKGVTYINNFSKIYDFYKSKYDEIPYEEFYIYYNDGYCNGQNAVGGSANKNTVGYMSMGYKTGIEDIDVMAHEYTHIVTRSIVNWNGSNETGAINEGYSDLFGEIIEGQINNKEPDWIMQGDNISVKRNIASPKSTKYPENVSDKNKSGEDYVHAYSTVISHAGYLMWNGIDGTDNKKIDTDTLAKIWYRALNFLHSDATFNQCADSVYKSAKTLKGITDEQLNCIIEAFEMVGIDVSTVNSSITFKGSKLYVKDTNLNNYSNYHLTISDMTDLRNPKTIIDEDVETDSYVLNLNEGRYRLKVKDNDINTSGDEYYLILTIWDSKYKQYEKPVSIYTNFGSVKIDDFTIPKDMTLTLGEVDVIEPETVPADATGYSIKWTSSDESVATVTPTGEECIVTSKGKGTTTITGELVSNGKTITKSTNVRVASQGRDTVLVLDVSGSMSGTPIDEMKKSAINFCNELLADEYNNRVGLVLYDDYIDSVDLTNDLDVLIDYIEGISSGGTTNMQEALATAGNMLDTQGKADNIKNIVVMADGLPNEGETSDTGKMSQLSQYSSYLSDVAYANAVVNTAEDIMSNYNMYSLGFFHDLSGVEKDFAVDLMKLLTNMPDGYHQVDTAENLQFAFGDIQETISDGSKVVINIACPVDVTVTYNGEALSSALSSYSDTASFGSLQLLGKNKDIKVLSLDPNAVYDILLNGTGNGTMNYSVNYLDDTDAIIDYRTFESIPITPTTKIDSNTNNSSGDITLNLDEDGDGTVDKVYSAAVNSVAELTYGDDPVEVEVVEETEPVKSDNTWVTVLVAVVFVIILLGVILIVVLLTSSNKKKNNDKSYSIPVIDPESKEKCGKINVMNGSMAGKEFVLESGKGYIVGKDVIKAQIVLSYDYEKVSREHCVISYNGQTQLYSVIDMSSNGTYYADKITAPLKSSLSKHRLIKNAYTELQGGSVLILGDEDCKIELQ